MKGNEPFMIIKFVNFFRKWNMFSNANTVRCPDSLIKSWHFGKVANMCFAPARMMIIRLSLCFLGVRDFSFKRGNKRTFQMKAIMRVVDFWIRMGSYRDTEWQFHFNEVNFFMRRISICVQYDEYTINCSSSLWLDSYFEHWFSVSDVVFLRAITECFDISKRISHFSKIWKEIVGFNIYK